VALGYRVYVLRNDAGRFYIGITEDVLRRINQHNVGGSKWTRGRGPWKLVWQSDARNLSQARRLELLLKKQKGGDGFYRLTGLTRLDS
jgi:putative endonuclease